MEGKQKVELILCCIVQPCCNALQTQGGEEGRGKGLQGACTMQSNAVPGAVQGQGRLFPSLGGWARQSPSTHVADRYSS